MFPVIVQAVLTIPLYLAALIYKDDGAIPMSRALDTTYAGLNAPQTLKHIIILGWVFLGLAIISASFERCYKWPKAVIIFGVIGALMEVMTFGTLSLYEPYLAVRR